jgi:hypothetical protein
VLHRHLTKSLCASAWGRTRQAERERAWTLHALVEFWTSVVLRAPTSLTQALGASAQEGGLGWAPVQATPEAFFQRCQTLSWRMFAEMFQGFVASVTPEVPLVYAEAMSGLRERFAGVWVIDGSRLDAIRHRLKLTWRTRAVILPGALWVAYDLFRGIVQRLEFTADAAQSEHERATEGLATIPAETLVVGDRLYAVPAFWEALHARGLWGVARRNRLVKLKTRGRLSEGRLGDGEVTDHLVDAGCGATAPRVRLRLIRVRQGRRTFAVLTNVLDPARLSAADVLALYPLRWTVERVFFDLKEVLNLHRFYAGNPNAVAMQVYAAAIVHVAMRVAQGQIAQAQGVRPEAISPAKLFPRMARASMFTASVEADRAQIVAANVGRSIILPPLEGRPQVTTTLGDILVETRQGPRRRRRFCTSRHRWISFRRVPGGRKLT